MTTTIAAVYERGVFRPIRQVVLSEGTRVEVVIRDPAPPRDPKAAAARLCRIAAKAIRTGQPECTSQDHDQFLYGKKARP